MPLQQSIAQFGRNSLTCVTGAKRGGGRPLFPFLPVPYPLPLPLSMLRRLEILGQTASCIPGGGGEGWGRLTWVNFCWVCAAGLSECSSKRRIKSSNLSRKYCSNFLNVETPIVKENQTLVPFWTQTFLSIVQQIFLAFMSTGHSFKGRCTATLRNLDPAIGGKLY